MLRIAPPNKGRRPEETRELFESGVREELPGLRGESSLVRQCDPEHASNDESRENKKGPSGGRAAALIARVSGPPIGQPATRGEPRPVGPWCAWWWIEPGFMERNVLEASGECQ